MSYTPGPLPFPPLWRDDTRHDEDYYTASQVESHTAAEVARAVAAERERCIKACAGRQLEDEPDNEGDFAYMHAVCDCIAAIRADPQRLQGKGE